MRNKSGRPILKMNSRVYWEILSTIGSRPAETGGILLGPMDSNDITNFYFDKSARCSEGTYSPDIVTLNKKLEEEWEPSRINFKGFAHSHPQGYSGLSSGDMSYIQRLLKINPHLDMFVAPIILPYEHIMQPLVVLNTIPPLQREAELILF